MIGVIATASEKYYVDAFFQLFKTPWEFCRESKSYDVVIVCGKYKEPIDARLVFHYSCSDTAFNNTGVSGFGAKRFSKKTTAALVQDGDTVYPIFGDLLCFDQNVETLICTRRSKRPVATRFNAGNQSIICAGFDLFQEIALLLTKGQPPEFSKTPAIDCHIDFIRRSIVREGLPLIEIPPRPEGYRFSVCLTHDVDFYSFRRHFLDRTFFGFLYRATVSSFLDFFKGVLPLNRLIRNWFTVLLIPLVLLGWVKDIWGRFDKYLEIEGDFPSTFFLIPKKNDPGRVQRGIAPRHRSVRYAINEVTDEIRLLLRHNREVGLHGIDAWLDRESAEWEMGSVARIIGKPMVGVRMHWLYFDGNSPNIIGETGFAYDSTLGYNDAIGFHNATVQAFHLPGSKETIEIPLNVMDTALFYPDRLNLTEFQAWDEFLSVVKQHEDFGGVLTINWHLRSVSPERLWGDFYVKILNEMKNRDVWFATCSQAAAWFQKRRDVEFNRIRILGDHASADIDRRDIIETPKMTLRVYSTNYPEAKNNGLGSENYEDLTIIET